jgi:hypothetical protein
MYAASTAFLTEITKSHTPVAKAQLLQRGSLVADDLPIISGTITDDSTAAIRRRAQVELAAEAAVMALLTKDVPSSTGLWPLGNELKIWAGVQYRDGTYEWIPQGVFRIAKPSLSDNGTVSISLDMYDRSRSVSRAKFTKPYSIANGVNYITAMKALLVSRLPWLTDNDFLTMTTSYLTPALVFTDDDDPWECLMNMASSIGAEIFWDNEGKCVIRAESDPSYTPPVFTYVDGESMNALEINRDLDDEEAFNGVIITGENSDLPAPVRGEAWDTDTSSPTYYDPSNPSASLYGAVPYTESSQYVTTNAQCVASAQALLTRVRGIIEQVSFTAINNPAHQSGDVVTFTHTAVAVDNNYILDSFTLGLGATATMSGTCRKRRVS